ncbi:MAG: fibronectin type III domain-containing protein [Candidatus Pacebacteria bacterium]|nr:fibronectin type III domain-containing protein [Candidatus Paceibacterota bacterium]
MAKAQLKAKKVVKKKQPMVVGFGLYVKHFLFKNFLFYKISVLRYKTLHSYYQKKENIVFLIQKIKKENKRKFKKLKKNPVKSSFRFLQYNWQKAVVVVLLLAIISPNLFFNKVQAATFTFTQTSWDAQPSPGSYPNHNSNQTGWTDYEARDSGIDTTSTPGQISLTTTTQSIVDTLNEDFTSGSFSNTTSSNNEVALSKNIAEKWTTSTVDSATTDGLVAHWKMDEGTGSAVSDISGNGNTGVIHGAQWIDGIYGMALDFENSNNDYIAVPDINNSLDTKNMTASAWVKRETFTGAQGIVAKNNSIWDDTDNYQILFSPGGTPGSTAEGALEFRWENIFGTSTSATTQAVVFNSNTIWYHIVFTRWLNETGNYSTRLYVNGVQQTLSCFQSLSGWVNVGCDSLAGDPVNNNYGVEIGRYGNATNTDIDGIIDDVKIYNYALTADQVALDYQRGIGAHSSISAVDVNNIFVSYYDSDNGDLLSQKTTDGGTTWTPMAVDTTGDSGRYSSIKAIDANTAFISYYASTTSDLNFAKTTDGGTTWATSSVNTTGNVGLYTSIDAIDANTAFISYYDFTNGDLKFAKSSNGGSSWTLSSPDTTGDVGLYTSIFAVDSSHIYISYYDATNGDLKFAKSIDGGTEWAVGFVDSTDDVGLYASIFAVDSNNIYISYYASTTGDIRFAKTSNGGTTWATSSVDTTGVVGLYSSILAVDPSHIYISYYDDTNDDLKLAQSSNQGASWTLSSPDTSGDTGTYSSVTAIANGPVFVSYLSSANYGLKFGKYYATYASSGTFTSAIKDVSSSGLGALTWSDNSFQTITLKARTGNQSNLSDATDFASCSAITNGADISSNSCVHDTDIYIQYQTSLSTDNTAQSPALRDIALNYEHYATTSPALTSSWYDSSSNVEVISGVSWQEQTILPTSTEVRMILKTAPDAGDSTPLIASSTDFLGPDGAITTYWNSNNTTAGGCVKVATGNPDISAVTCAIIPSSFTDGSNDQWFAYQLVLVSDGRYTPITYQTSIQYVVNAPPVISNIKDEDGVADLNQNSTGDITLQYDILDEDSSTAEVYYFYDIGLTTVTSLTQTSTTTLAISNSSKLPSSGYIMLDQEVINYSSNDSISNVLSGLTRGDWPGSATSTTRAATHATSTVVYIVADSADQGEKADLTATSTTLTATLSPKIDIPNVFTNSCAIKVVANDGNAANQVSTSTGATSAVFTLDTKNPSSPTLSINDGDIDASSTSVFLTMSVSDDTILADSLGYMMISNESDFSAGPENANSGQWITYSSSTIWSLTSGDGTKTVYILYKDTYGNVSATTTDTIILDTTPPNAPANVIIRDISNVEAGEYWLFVAWDVVDNPSRGDFKQYNLWRSIDGSDYGSSPYATIDTRTLNYIFETNLSTSTTYYYKLTSEDNISNISADSAVVSDRPNGQGGTDTTAPTITSEDSSSVTSQSATITWTTDELSNSIVSYGTSPSDFSSTSTIATMVTSHSIVLSGLNASTTYYYRIQSSDPSSNTGTSDNSGLGFSFTTNSGPSISNVAVAAATNNTAQITWTTNIVASSYVVYSTSSDLADALSFGSETETTSHTVNLSNLTQGTKYYFYARSISSGPITTEDKNIVNGAINYYNFTTLEDSEAPSISNVLSFVNDTSAVVTWQTSEESNSQVVYGATKSYGSTTTLDTTLTTQHSVTITGLTKTTTYYFKVFSTDANDNGVEDDNSGASYSFTTADEPGDIINITVVSAGGGGGGSGINTVPPVISNVRTISVNSNSAVVGWETDEMADSFVEFGENILYGDTSGDYTFTNKNHIVNLRRLSLSTLYHYRVLSKDTFGNLASSTDQTFTTLALGEVSTETEPEATTSVNVPIQGEESFVNNVLSILSKIKQTKSLMSISEALNSSAKNISSPLAILGENPEVQAGPDFAVILWTTDQLANSVVAFSPDNDYSSGNYQLEMGNLDEQTIQHEVKLTGLTPSTLYHFQAKSKNSLGIQATSKDLTFETTSLTPKISGANLMSVGETEIQLSWKTDMPSKSEIEITDITTGEKIIKKDESYLIDHQFKIESLMPLTNYNLKITSQSENGIVATSQVLPFSTVVGSDPPVISQVRISASLVPGKVEKIQTIITWKTNKPSTSQFYFNEGFTDDEGVKQSNELDKKLVNDHIIITTILKPGKVYQFQVESQDAGGNTTISPKYVFLTPKPKQDVIDLIIKNFEDNFGFMKKLSK